MKKYEASKVQENKKKMPEPSKRKNFFTNHLFLFPPKLLVVEEMSLKYCL